MPVPSSTTVSFVIDAVPRAASLPARPSELRQPASSPAALALPHGHAVADPSPAQKLEYTAAWKPAIVAAVSLSVIHASAAYGSGCAMPSGWPPKVTLGFEKYCTRVPGAYDMIVRHWESGVR